MKPLKEYKIRIYYSGYFDVNVAAETEEAAIEEAEYVDPYDSDIYREQFLSSLVIQPDKTKIIE